MKLTIIRLQHFSPQDHRDLQKIWPQANSHELAQLLDEQHQLYVARFNDRLLAAVKLVISGDEGRLSQLVVRDVTRRRGVGLYLLEDTLTQNPQIARWTMASDGTSEAAIVTSFMQAGGFTARGNEWVKD
ncbi:aspartate 1-decarboxylase autocleavage activator PanM [Erwiniaceae bacterium CAU 1747]